MQAKLWRANQMTQQIKSIGTKADDLSSIPEILKWQNLQCRHAHLHKSHINMPSAGLMDTKHTVIYINKGRQTAHTHKTKGTLYESWHGGTHLYSVFGKQRQENCCQVTATLVYIESSYPTWGTTWGTQPDLSQNNNKKKPYPEILPHLGRMTIV